MIQARFHVPKMDCATEKEVISSRLASVSGIERIDFDLIERVVIVTHAPVGDVPAAVELALIDIDMAPSRVASTTTGAPAAASDGLPAAPDGKRLELTLLAVSGAASIGAEVVAWTTGNESSIAVIALALVGLGTGGIKTLRKGIVAARTFTLNINLLMMIAVAGALAIQQWPEAAMVTFLFACAEVIESRSVDRARDAIRSLMVLAPDLTRQREPDGTWREVDTATIALGAVIQIRPGERLPLDGKVVAGKTSIDQAPITGESIPVDKMPGDPVFAGSVNQQGMIEVEVTAGAGDTTLAHIARAIRAAQSQQAPTERFVDRFSRWYTPIVVLVAIAIATVPLAFGEPLRPWLYKALVLLVIACPCALVISTPVTIVSGLAAAARRGLLVKGGGYLEQARHLRVIAVDKTGTVTEGHPRLTDVIPLGALSRDDVLARAAGLEATSAHPLSRAVVAGFAGEPPGARDVVSTDGRGIEGTIGDDAIGIGSHRFAEERGVCAPAVEAALASLEQQGKSVMVVWRGADAIGVLGVADTVRATSVEAIRSLHAQGVRVVMLTGDNPTTARAVADQVGIDDVAADLLPEDKLTRIGELMKAHGAVGMVGDGVNDAPALARATIGFAMGAAGSDTALETADVALMSDDLRGVSTLIDLSRRTATTLWTNIAFAIAVKVVFFVLAFAGVATLWMAVFADMGASILVAANGLRLLRSDSALTARL